MFQKIENYLMIKHTSLDENIGEEIEKLRQKAILDQIEEDANYCWCLKQIYSIQKEFISAITSLKDGKYEDAWAYIRSC